MMHLQTQPEQAPDRSAWQARHSCPLGQEAKKLMVDSNIKPASRDNSQL